MTESNRHILPLRGSTFIHLATRTFIPFVVHTEPLPVAFHGVQDLMFPAADENAIVGLQFASFIEMLVAPVVNG